MPQNTVKTDGTGKKFIQKTTKPVRISTLNRTSFLLPFTNIIGLFPRKLRAFRKKFFLFKSFVFTYIIGTFPKKSIPFLKIFYLPD